MKVSLNLAQYYSDVDLKKIPHETLLQRVGAQLGAVEEVIDWAPKYKGIVVVKIVSCEDHPNADRLHVCMIDDGGKVKGVKRDSKGLVQVVCGAPNVKAGMFVAWIPPGATVPSTHDTQDPFVLEVRELRGVVSNGMLASAKELGISDSHEVILEILPEEVVKSPKPGDPFVEYLGLDDFIIDCENKMFTHRPDCFGNLGVARELAGISGLTFKSPDWYLKEPRFETKSGIKLHVKNDAGKLVLRFMVVAMKNVQVKPSPVWIQAALTRVGIKPINNVVDMTNFAMHLTGQPLHAFDYDKLASNQLGPRMAKKGEKLALLNGKTIELHEDDIVIATDKKVVGLAGIMGGTDTEVDENTKNIVIECATFDMYTIRRSSMNHGLFTDASTRYTKGQSPLQNARVLAYAMSQLKAYGLEQASAVQDVHGKLNNPTDVVVTAQFINERLGSSLSIKEIGVLLEKVEFSIVSVPANKNRLHVRPPFWRTDIELPEDIVEEAGRLYGFDKLPVVLPIRTSKATDKNDSMSLKMHLRYKLKEAGANEVLTYSFVHGDLMRKTGTDPDKWAYHVRNALSPDLQYYRTSLMPSLLDKVHGNIRADIVRSDDNSFAMYEIGKAHVKDQLNDEELPEEMERIALVFTADNKTAERLYEGAALYQTKHYLLAFVREGLEFVPLESNEYPMTAPYQIGRSAIVSYKGEALGVIGEFREDVKKALKLPDFTAGFELDLSVLAKMSNAKPYMPISQYPKMQQDITLAADAKTVFSDMYGLLQDGLLAAESEHGYHSVLVPRDIFQAEDSDKKHLTFRIWLSHPVRTLTTEEMNRMLNNLAAAAKEKFQAERI